MVTKFAFLRTAVIQSKAGKLLFVTPFYSNFQKLLRFNIFGNIFTVLDAKFHARDAVL